MPDLNLKDYLYAGLITLLIGLFSYWTIHERHAGAAAIIAADARTVAIVKSKDIAIEAAANAALDKASQIYEKAVVIPAVADLGVMCQSRPIDTLPTTAADTVSRTGQAEQVPGRLFDPSGDILTGDRQSDALVADLQSEIATLRSEMVAAAKARQ